MGLPWPVPSKQHGREPKLVAPVSDGMGMEARRTELERQIFDYLDQGLPALLKQKLTSPDTKMLCEIIADFVEFRVLPGHTPTATETHTKSIFEPSEGPGFLEGLKKV